MLAGEDYWATSLDPTHEIVRNDIPYVLVGSIRDDGSILNVTTDAVEGQQAGRPRSAVSPQVGSQSLSAARSCTANSPRV